jgi:streptomycin 3"-adenylyltransferase
MAGGVDGLLAELEPDTRNALLTLARIWSTVATGVIRSKDAAAEWALPRLPEEHRLPLESARASYLGDAEERWDALRPQVRALADHVVAEIGRLVAAQTGLDCRFPRD